MAIDFEAARRTLSQFEAQFSGDIDDRTVQRILTERAAAMAQRDQNEQTREEFRQVIAVRRGTYTLGFPTGSVVEIRHVRISWLPHGTAVVPGVFQVRGQLYCLIDVLPLLGAAVEQGQDEATLVAIVSMEQGYLGVRIDESIGTRLLYTDEIDKEFEGYHSEMVEAVTRDLVAVIDVQALFQRPEITLNMAG